MSATLSHVPSHPISPDLLTTATEKHRPASLLCLSTYDTVLVFGSLVMPMIHDRVSLVVPLPIFGPFSRVESAEREALADDLAVPSHLQPTTSYAPW